MSRRGRRRLLFVDRELQGRLLFALLALQLALLAGASSYLGTVFSTALDTASAAGAPVTLAELLPRMLGELALVMLVCIAANACLMHFAHHRWSQRVERVLGRLRERLQRVGELDLREPPPAARDSDGHRLLALCERWIEGERRRMLAVRIAAARLPRPLPGRGAGREAEDALAALREAADALRSGRGNAGCKPSAQRPPTESLARKERVA